MKKMITIFIGISIAILPLTAQTVIFSEDFESGAPNEAWEQFIAGEEPIQAVTMSTAPATLDGGGNYVGMIWDEDVSHAGASYILAGDTSLTNYTIEADVWCYVNNSGGSAYTGLIVYGDSSRQGSVSHGFVYKFVADFDGDNRFRLYNNQLDGWAYTFAENIDASGYYDGDAWHHMKLSVETVGEATHFTCYFDGTELGSYVDDGNDQFGSGKFGLWAFQNNGGLQGYFDNIVVTQTSSNINDEQDLTPTQFTLKQNYPNPFNPTTSIDFTLNEGAESSLNIFNINGQLVQNLANGYMEAKEYSIQWDGLNTNGHQVPAGVYIYTLNHGQSSQTKKMILLK
ncbi:MAG: T9SS type A sorting domain-containing protein [Candidatus Marinimicrobia bacterium]|nr:T9SS type A sorting domain-containing protein [Candidatus Neomarinimicrobiota bacterium]